MECVHIVTCVLLFCPQPENLLYYRLVMQLAIVYITNQDTSEQVLGHVIQDTSEQVQDMSFRTPLSKL